MPIKRKEPSNIVEYLVKLKNILKGWVWKKKKKMLAIRGKYFEMMEKV